MLVMVLQYIPMNCGDIEGLAVLPTNTSGLIIAQVCQWHGTYKRHRERVGAYETRL